jgi:hypothetical protein
MLLGVSPERTHPNKKPRLSRDQSSSMNNRKVKFAKELEEVFILPASNYNEEDVPDDHDDPTNEQTTTTRGRTSQVTVLSSQHGRARRELREITKFDLQSAVKYGIKTRGHNCPKTRLPRWKYTYGNVVYITDHTSTTEVTSYRQPISIQPAQITTEMMEQHVEDRQILNDIDDEQQQLCATHSIIVIDQSGSMRESGVKGFRNRSQAAYGVLALEYIAEQLHQRGDEKVLDAVSVIEMNDEATVLFRREPLDWILFNKLLDRQKQAQPRSHGNYNNALKAAQTIIDAEIASECKGGGTIDLSSEEDLNDDDDDDMPIYAIIFLSDGRPSDRTDDDNFSRLLLLSSMATRLKSNFRLHTIGLGNADNEDFSQLKAMSSWVNGQSCGSEATFAHSQLSTAELGAAFSSISTSMTATRTEAMSGSTMTPRVKKDVQLRSNSTPRAERMFQVYHDSDASRWRYDHTQDDGRQSSWPWKQLNFKNKTATGFDQESEPFGKGAERLAYMFHEVGRNQERLGKPLVAKETIALDDEERKVSFHSTFCRVQYKASLFAEEFNKVVKRTPSLFPSDSAIRVPLLEFLKCHVYEYTSPYDQVKCGLLVEDYLHGKFTKYNSNNGYVRSENKESGRKIDLVCGEAYMTDFLQAFSHWTYWSTEAKFLVCDLQGVLNMEGRRPKFMLTDPCICSKHKREQRRLFGRSDMGSKGFRMFRKNHVCNEVCKGLGLPGFGSRTRRPR